MKRSIRTKIIVMLVALLVIPLSILFFWINQKVTSSVLELGTNKLETASTGVSNTISNHLQTYAKPVQMLSNTHAVKNILNFSQQEKIIHQMIQDYLEKDPSILIMYMGSSDKKTIMEPIPPKEGYDPTSRPWYQETAKAKDLLWTDPYLDATLDNTMVVTVANPIMNGSRVVGVAAIDLSLDYLSEVVSSIDIGRSGHNSIFSSNGMIIADPNPDLVGTEVSSDILSIITSSDQEIGTFDQDGEDGKRLVSYHKLPNVNWYVTSSLTYDEIYQTSNSIRLSILIITIISLIIAIAIGWFFAKRITSPILNLRNKMNLVASGDFRVHTDIKSGDELEDLSNGFNTMVENVKRLLFSTQRVSNELFDSSSALASFSEQTATASTQVTHTIEEIARGASDQATETEVGVKTANALSEKFVDLSSSNKTMNQMVDTAKEQNQVGINTLQDLRHASGESLTSNNRVEQAILQLDKSNAEINNMLETITSIASQTNLLALNASIEAARAGEAGKGFAVVADEIRKLAEGSDEAAQEIREIIEKTQSDSKQTVSIMQEVKTTYEKQNQSVEKVNEIFQEIFESIDQISNQLSTMNEDIDILSQNKEKIVFSMENISAVSEETAAASEEVTASMQEQSASVSQVSQKALDLQYQAEELKKQLQSFQIDSNVTTDSEKIVLSTSPSEPNVSV